VSASVLFTIGYEGRTQAELIDQLRLAGVTLLIDVRALPLSRKAGFSKRVLAASVEATGLAYAHLRPLGTPKPGRDAARRGDAHALERIYAEHLQGDPAQHALAEATALAREHRACLLCYERDPACCHRRFVAELIAETIALPVTDL